MGSHSERMQARRDSRTHPEGLEAARVGQQRCPVAPQSAPLVFQRRKCVAPQQADGRAVGYLRGPRAVLDVLRSMSEVLISSEYTL